MILSDKGEETRQVKSHVEKQLRRSGRSLASSLMPKLRSPEGRARMTACGLDPEAELKKATALKDAFLAADEAAEKAQEHSLQAGADEAHAAYEVFKSLRQSVQELKQANPLDTQLEELGEYLEAMAKRMPKEQKE
jgi:hypothetical protein